MSEENNSDRKHQASQKKLDRLTQEGVFLRAKEFYSGISTVASLLCLLILGSQFITIFSENFYLIFKKISDKKELDSFDDQFFYTLLTKNIFLLVPVFITTIFFFLLSVTIFGKITIPKKIIQLKGDRLNFIKNLKNIYSWNTGIELTKSILKLSIFLFSITLFFYFQMPKIVHLARFNQFNLLSLLITIFKYYMVQIIILLILIASMDAFISKKLYNKKSMMTTQELKDENKETEGNPELKRKVRQLQQRISMQRMQKTIPTATVIITNPTHFAVAIRYRSDKDSSPVILAKGIDYKALQIRKLGIKHGVPIYPAPELARAIYKSGKEGGTIHPDLYMAVALVLNYIFQLQEFNMGRSRKPESVVDYKIPPHLK